ncbi:hypothetical protein SNOG_09288 [Parastagonospora nodorum SN15]|uniref:ABC1 atypical kinase-like domain-containing protein n=1 Tax=Phaeosphaeria nodorum (strain SN15 / ATCC MYA-4574 / FGSC 10173) TaxID=321614 RepID=Q0UG26_PHANO|nr:hypothetical protein SNOG_09288 [Parastagonospora nodorum SN15]EAT83480.2 hypothetical protein SNOG_09288 [Parastagonospora nodorum SN15]
MAGRRLVDAAKLFNASKSITQKHIALRSNQLEKFNKTSSLAKAVKNQTDRVTLTAAAAIELSKRFSEEAPAYARAAAQQATGTSKPHEDIPRRETVERNTGVPGKEEGLQQDHHYERSEQNSAIRPPPEAELEVEQEEALRRPLPDGTIPTSGVTLEEERGQDTFPARPLGETPKEPLIDEKHDPARHEDVGIKPVESDETTIPLPGQPRATRQASDIHVDDQQLNQDVFYKQDTRQVPLEQEELPEGINTDIFHSTRVKQMLGSDPDSRKELKNKQNQPEKLEKPEKPTQPAQTQTTEKEMQNLASQLAQDAQSNTATTEYAGLGTSMALGAVGESLRRVTGSAASTGGSLMLSPGNIEILVSKLSKMRGAALKLGQMISIQDMKMLPPQIHDVLQRVQDSADYMPAYQRNKVLTSNLGDNWRDLFDSFEDVPIAAASIGQVHKAVLKSNGQAVAVKIQYPGVASSIDSDLNNLSVLLTASRLLPRGLFLDKTIANARTELGWECNYTREAECQMRFRDFLADDTDVFTVPKVFFEASGPTVLTAKLMHGVGVTKLKTLKQEQRDWIGTQILRLCLREIVEFKFMQTDPNWTNFLYNAKAQKVELLDFGASREYPDEFVGPYVNILIGASQGDRNAIRDGSIELGYLTGDESPTMLDAHIQSVLTLAEPFKADGPEIYDFRDQTITDRVRELIPVMVKERLAPPPEETYSLHRKLSGAFLLCARLGSRVPCRELFSKAIATWEGKGKIL